MKKLYAFLFATFFLISGQLLSQGNLHKCAHRQSFTPSLISDTLDALAYEIHLTNVNTTAKTIEAWTLVTLESKIDDLNQITLELMDLTVDQVFVENFAITGFSHVDPWLYIPLNSPINTGDQVMVKVVYHGEPFHEDWGGFHWSGTYAFNLGVGFESDPHNLGKAWFPCIDDFHDRAFYDVFVTVDTPKKAVCGGTLMEVVNNGNGTETYHWKLNGDIPTYLASVAVGEYENVPDTFISMTGQEIPIGIWVRPFDTAKVEGSFATLKPILAAFENYFGPYQWERVGYVGTAIGAMEHSTNIAYPNFCITGSLNYESLFAHELSHQYFGDLVTCESAEDMWLNEGWAVFCESLYREAIYGVQAYRDNMFERHQDVLHTCHVDDGGYRAVYGIPTEYTYGTTVYQKGALVAHTLRHYIGDDLFFPAIKAFIQEYKFNHASSWNLRDFLSNHTGIDLTNFFDAWVFRPGFSEFSIDSFSVQPAGNQYNVAVFAKQKLDGTAELANSNRVEVTFMDENWQTETVLMEFSGETGANSFLINLNPEIAMMDYYDKVADATNDMSLVLKQTGLTNLYPLFAKINAVTLPENDSAFIRVTHRWVPPDPLKTPLQGLTLSDYRHWRIDGIFPEGTDITGSFNYNKYNNLDGNLMTDPFDSIVILYRPNRAADWQGVPFTKIGSPNVGYLEVQHLQKGEYTLAMWDDLYVGIKQKPAPTGNEIRIFPNPAQDEVFVEFGNDIPAVIDVYDSKGQLFRQFQNNRAGKNLRIESGDWPDGTYLFNFYSEDATLIDSKKLIHN